MTALDILEQMSPRDLESVEIQLMLIKAGIRSAGWRENNINVKIHHDHDHDQYGAVEVQLTPQTDHSAAAAHNDDRVNTVSHINTNQTAATTSMLKKFMPKRTIIGWCMRFFVKYMEFEMSWLPQKAQETLMVAATLIATVSFQAAVSPPGGYLQQNEEHKVGNVFCRNKTLPREYCWAGTPVLAYIYKNDYAVFLRLNFFSFYGSISVLLLLMSGFPLNKVGFWLLTIAMAFSITFMALTFNQIVYLATPDDLLDEAYSVLNRSLDLLRILVLLVGVFHLLRLLISLGRKLYKFKLISVYFKK